MCVSHAARCQSREVLCSPQGCYPALKSILDREQSRAGWPHRDTPGYSLLPLLPLLPLRDRRGGGRGGGWRGGRVGEEEGRANERRHHDQIMWVMETTDKESSVLLLMSDTNTQETPRPPQYRGFRASCFLNAVVFSCHVLLSCSPVVFSCHVLLSCSPVMF